MGTSKKEKRSLRVAGSSAGRMLLKLLRLLSPSSASCSFVGPSVFTTAVMPASPASLTAARASPRFSGTPYGTCCSLSSLRDHAVIALDPRAVDNATQALPTKSAVFLALLQALRDKESGTPCTPAIVL